MYRQGDVLVFSCDEPTEDLLEIRRDSRQRLILAEGEATGHAHAISAKKAALYLVAGIMYLHLREQSLLQHEEHATIDLDPGWYQVKRQREYSPEEIRWVND